MNDNGKANEELSPEALEQAAGGGIYTTASDAEIWQKCDTCGHETKWIYLQGKWVCGSCGKSGNSNSNGQRIYYTR